MFGKINNKAAGNFIRDDFRKIQEAQGYLCFWCGFPICEHSADPDAEATKDHLLPVSMGGGEFRWNIVAACLACNRMRENKLPGVFLRERWAFAQLVGNPAQKSTRIPLSKERVLPVPEENFDDEGNLIKSHLEVSPLATGIIRALSEKCRMEPSDRERRMQVLRDQVRQINRAYLENLGQLTLQFDKPKSVAAALCETEAQTLLVAKGLAIANALRRQA